MARFLDVFSDVTKEGHKIPKEKYLPSGCYPIIDQGHENIAGYCNDADGIYSDVPAIIFGDHTRIIKYIDTPFFLGADGVKLLKPISSNTNCKYLYYALCSAKIPNTGYNRHFKWLKELEIFIPDCSTQAQIVFILDKITNLISLRKQQLAKLDELVKVRFVEMFGDPLINSKDFSSRYGYDLFSFSSGKFLEESRRLVDGVPVYGGNGIAWYTDSPLISEETIVLGRVGAYCGNVKLTGGPAWITDNAIYIKQFKTKLCNCKFLYVLMEQLEFARFADYSGQPKITQKPLESMKYIVPPIELQNQFSQFFDKINDSKLTIQQSLDKLEVLKKALMQEYLEGA